MESNDIANKFLNLVFDSPEPIEVPVTIKGKEYILREASESSAAKYLDAYSKSMRVSEGTDGNKTVVAEKTYETEALLVSYCLLEKTETGFKTVPLITIQSWVHRVVHPIFEVAEEISGLKRKKRTKDDILKELKKLQSELKSLNTQEDELKNSLSATTDTSV